MPKGLFKSNLLEKSKKVIVIVSEKFSFPTKKKP